MSQVETIKIVAEKTKGNDSGFAIINKDDFDPKQHKEFVEPASPAPKKAAKAE